MSDGLLYFIVSEDNHIIRLEKNTPVKSFAEDFQCHLIRLEIWLKDFIHGPSKTRVNRYKMTNTNRDDENTFLKN